MRIVVNGQQAFGRSVLEALLERGDNVVAVYTAPEKGGRSDPLADAARERGLPLFQPGSFKKPEVAEEFATLKPDLGVMAYVTLLVPQSILGLPTHGTIQYHPSLLPKHRGPSSINWPIIHGETKTGLTIFWPDEGLDTGPVLLQKEVDIGPDATLGSLYFDHLYPMGVAATLEAVDLVKAGEAPSIVQDESQATYEGWCKKEAARIDWSAPAAQIYNLIRGTNPQPGAWTTHAGRTLQIYDSKVLDETGGEAGSIVEVDDAGFCVATGSGRVCVHRVKLEGEKKVAAHEFVEQAGLRVGDRLA